MLNPDYKEMLSLLLEESVEFVLVGAYALAVHGFPRATGDIDLLVRPSAENAEKVYRCLARFGAPMEGIRSGDFSEPGLVFQIGVAPRRIDILTAIDGLSFQEAAKDAIIVRIEDLDIPVLSKANLIKNKESTGRMKDAVDAETLKKAR
jgi:hypothetical protein